jgi:hypothetical protein
MMDQVQRNSSAEGYVVFSGRVIVKDEVGSCGRNSYSQFKILSQYLPEGAEEDHEEPQSE